MTDWVTLHLRGGSGPSPVPLQIAGLTPPRVSRRLPIISAHDHGRDLLSLGTRSSQQGGDTLTVDRHRRGYVVRRIGRALLGYGVALLFAVVVVAVWWLTR
ncbi:hypothetical protein GCM10010404_51310 [Nonomuraea africana]